jgi:spore germination protein GerM
VIRQLFSVFGLFLVVGLVYYGLNVVQQKTPDTAQGNSVFVYLYFNDQLYPVRRPLPVGLDPLTQSLQELMNGVTEKEAKRGLVTQIPLGLTISSVELHNGVAHIFFGPELLKISGGAAQIEGILSQVLYTATRFPQVKSIVIRITGKTQCALALGGEGYIIDGPMTKDYFKRR